MRPCPRCGGSPPEVSFGIARRETSGLQTYCEKCSREYKREYRRENPDKIRAYNATRDKSKSTAHDRLNSEIKFGRMRRPDSCVRCCVPCKPEGHHMDYAKPFEVEWLCRSCHQLEHFQQRKGAE